MPSRDGLVLRKLGAVARQISLYRVVGADYEFWVIGDALAQAYGTDFIGMRVSAMCLLPIPRSACTSRLPMTWFA